MDSAAQGVLTGRTGGGWEPLQNRWTAAERGSGAAGKPGRGPWAVGRGEGVQRVAGLATGSPGHPGGAGSRCGSTREWQVRMMEVQGPLWLQLHTQSHKDGEARAARKQPGKTGFSRVQKRMGPEKGGEATTRALLHSPRAPRGERQADLLWGREGRRKGGGHRLSVFTPPWGRGGVGKLQPDRHGAGKGHLIDIYFAEVHRRL